MGVLNLSQKIVLFILLLAAGTTSISSVSIEPRLAQKPNFPFNSRQATDPAITPRNLSSLISEANKIPLTISEKRQIISTITRFMIEINPHRFLQLNLLKVDIVKELTAFSEILKAPEYRNQTNVEFHEQMMDIFQKMNDKHSLYLKPKPLLNSFATLGFLVKDFFVDKDVTKRGKPRRRYVAYVPDGVTFENKKFRAGSEIIAWNGEEITGVVRRLGSESYGSNIAAQISSGMFLLSIRSLGQDPIPFKKSVVVSFRNAGGGPVQNVAVPWQFFQVDIEKSLEDASRNILPYAGGSAHDNTRKLVAWAANMGQGNLASSEHEIEIVRISKAQRTSVEVASQFTKLFSAEVITTQFGDIGRLILPSFNSTVTDDLVDEMSRVLRLMPNRGLIVDVRDNIGGHPEYVKAVLELTSEKEVSPQPISVRASDLLTELLSQDIGNAPEIAQNLYSTLRNAGFDTARSIGEDFTGPIGDLYNVFKPQNSMDVRQETAFHGPVVTVYNGLTLSAGDLFVAAQLDQNRSLVVGTSDNSGAAGASTMSFSEFQSTFPTVLKPLPGGVDFSSSFMRFYRTGAESGAIVENFGVVPPLRYYPTLNDTIHDDCDLFEYLGSLLVSKAS